MYGRYVALREKKGVTDYRVAVETGITKSTFSDWKSGRSVPKADKLLSLAKYVDVPVEYFLEEEKSPDVSVAEVGRREYEHTKKEKARF